MKADPKIVVIGAGPTGLGAGYRLQELGYHDWVILAPATNPRTPTRSSTGWSTASSAPAW